MNTSTDRPPRPARPTHAQRSAAQTHEKPTRPSNRFSGSDFMHYANDNAVVKAIYDFTHGPQRGLFIGIVVVLVLVSLYFPVRVPGALLQMGDVHATMGDAELCGTGIEIAAQITVRVNVLKNFELNWPILETFGPAGKWYVNASAQEYNEALVCASKEMQRLLMNITGWDAVETYMYMSVQSDVEISQGCKPCEVQLSLRIGTPKLTEFPPLVG